MELPNKVILIKHYNEIVHYIAFYKSVKIIMELPHSIWNGFSTPPPLTDKDRLNSAFLVQGLPLIT